MEGGCNVTVLILPPRLQLKHRDSLHSQITKANCKGGFTHTHTMQSNNILTAGKVPSTPHTHDTGVFYYLKNPCSLPLHSPIHVRFNIVYVQYNEVYIQYGAAGCVWQHGG